MKTITQVVQNLVKPYIDNQDQAVESNIAPVETDATSSTGSYSQGEQLILNKILYDVTAAITVGDPLEVGTNIAVAPKISAAIGGKQEQIEVSSMPTASASNVGKVLIYIGATTSTYTSGQSYQSTLEDGNYIWKPTSISSVDASDVVYDNQTSGLTATDSQAAIDELASQNQTLTNQVKDMNNVLGAKNLLPISLKYLKSINTNGTWNGNAYTVDSVTYTVNTDSQGNIANITTSGTASANSAMNIYGTDTSYGENNFSGMILNGCPSGGGTAGTDYRIVAFIGNSQDGTGHSTINDTGDGVTLTNASYLRIYLRIPNGYSSSLVFEPMIRPASITDDTYVPYAKTNKELTDDVIEIIGDTSTNRLTKLDPQPSECQWDYCYVYDNGILLQTMGLITLNADISTNEFITVGTLPVGHRPKADRQLQCAMVTGSGSIYGTSLMVRSNGNVQFNVRPNMKTHDQYLTYGVVLL